MESKVVLITGASGGFGLACAELLAELGHRVYGTSRRADFPEAASDGPRQLVMIPMDVCDDESVRVAVEFVLKREGRLDVVVNNAGVVGRYIAMIRGQTGNRAGPIECHL